MRLAIIRRRYNPYGGAERFIERLTPMLAERGIETTIISANWVSQKESSIPVIDVGVQGWSRSAKFKSFAENVDVALRNQQVSKRFDLIQTHERLTGAHLYRAGDGVHGAWFNRLQRESGPIKSWWLARDPYHRAVIETERKMAADKSLLYVANSRMIFEELQQYLSIDLNRINLIPNGVDVTRFTPCSAEQKRDSREMLAKVTGLELKESSRVIGFVGSGFQRKGVPQLIGAMAQMEEVFLLICGQDSDADQIRRLISARGLGARVALTGPMKDVRPLLWATDVFSLPSLYDPSSNAVMEALACGLPVVITKNVGMADEIVAAGAGLICERGEDALADALRLSLKPEKLPAMSVQAREFANQYDERIVVQAWLALYEKVLRQSGHV